MASHRKPADVRRKIITGIAAVGTLAGILYALQLHWTTGLEVALWAAGLQSPQAGLELLSETIKRPQAHAGHTTSTTVGSGISTAPSGVDQDPFNEEAEDTYVIPENKGDGGQISEQQMTSGSKFVNGVAIRDRSSNEDLSLEKEAVIPPELVIEDTDAPQVLIVHTHTTETYMPYYAGYYNDGDTPRSTDESKNVAAVGRAITAQLQAAGIGVIHDTTVHDYPKYTGAYTRSSETVEKNLKKYPSIKVVLDVHRDGIMLDDTTKIKPTTKVNGKKAAQMMLVMGVKDTKDIPHPNWQENLHFAMALQSNLHTAYPGLVRPISCVDSRYNQHMCSAYILIEMGSEANTLGEAIYSGQLLGKQLGELLNSLKET